MTQQAASTSEMRSVRLTPVHGGGEDGVAALKEHLTAFWTIGTVPDHQSHRNTGARARVDARGGTLSITRTSL